MPSLLSLARDIGSYIEEPRGGGQGLRLRILGFLLGVGLFLGTFLIPAAPVSAFHWCDPLVVTVDPLEGHVGGEVSITITLENAIDDALTVSAIEVDFLWDATIWDWGTMSLPPLGSQSEIGVIELPTSEGDYPVDITVYGKASRDFIEETCDFTGTFTVLPLPPPPSLIVRANPNGGATPLTVNFDVTVNEGLAPFTYSWTFGDGSSGAGSSVTHVYTTPGTFTAQVVVTDSRERSVTDSVTVTVAESGLNIAGLGVFLTLVLLISLVIVAVAVAVIIIVLLRRRSRGAPPALPPPLGP